MELLYPRVATNNNDVMKTERNLHPQHTRKLIMASFGAKLFTWTEIVHHNTFIIKVVSLRSAIGVEINLTILLFRSVQNVNISF